MAKISVIVPIYNVEKYLKECLQSLVNQTFQDIEIICINDGSTDNSLNIINQFASKFRQIKIINQENLGVSAARNIGIETAKSDYIMFLDGDDYYRKNTCQKAFSAITENDSDIGIFGITEKYGLFHKSCNVNKNIKRAYKQITNIDLWKFQTYSVNKIYKKSFLLKNNIRFPHGIKTAEDLIFSLNCLFNNPKYCFINKPLYVYRKFRQNSATNNVSGVQHDLEALKFFTDTEIFQKQSTDSQLKVIEKFCSGAWNYYKRNKNSISLRQDIKKLLEFIEEKYSKNDLKQFKKYNQLVELFTIC